MFAIKISGYWQEDDGYARNTTTGERTNDGDMAGLRLAARLEATDRLSWNVAAAYMEANGENLLNFDCDPRNPSNCSGRFVTTGMLTGRRTGGVPQYSLPVTGDKANYPLGNEVGTTLLTSNIEWAGENHTLNLITGFVDMRQRFGLDFADGRGLPNVAVAAPTVRGFANGGFAILNDGRHRQFTQEVKLTGGFGGDLIDYVAGVYFYDETNRTDFADLFTLDIGTPAGLPLLLADRLLRNETTATAGYAQVDLNLTARFTATAGIRYTDEEKTFSIGDNRGTCAVNPVPFGCLNNNLVAGNGAIIPRTLRTKLWTPRFALNFKPTDDVLLFASATRGFKSGGWNARGTDRRTLLPFDPEIVWSYEAGAKTEWLDNRLRVNVTGFFLDVKDLQTPSAFVSPTGGVTFITQNFADYENRGLELEVTAVPVEGLNLYFNVGFQDDKYKVADTLAPNRFGIKSVRQQQADCLAQLAARQIPLAPNTAAPGTPPNNAPDCAAGIVTADGGIATPVRTPDWTLAFGGSWDLPVASAGIVIAPSVNFVYRSPLETGTANATIWTGASPPRFDGTVYPFNAFSGGFVTGSRTDAHWIVNASLAIRTDDDNWLLALECENCFDEVYNQSSLVNYTYINPPRTWMLRARRRF
jgi:iron complex outermembrane receptor protein